MKLKLIITIIFFCILKSAFSQEIQENNNKFKFGLSVSENYSLFDGATLNPGLLFKHNKHSVLISWKIYQRSDSYYKTYDYADYAPIDKRLGMDVQYGLSLIEFKKRFVLNFISELNWTSIDRKFDEVSYTPVGGPTQTAKYTRNQDYISILIGYGIDYKIIGNLYAFQNFSCGLGGFYEIESLDAINPSYNVYEETNVYGENIEFSIKVKFGLFYLF